MPFVTRLRDPVPLMSDPSKVTAPRLGVSPATARPTELLPAPFGPSRAAKSRAPTSRSTPLTAMTSPYRTSSPRTVSIGSALQVRVVQFRSVPQLGRCTRSDDLAQVEDVDLVDQVQGPIDVVLDQ